MWAKSCFALKAVKAKKAVKTTKDGIIQTLTAERVPVADPVKGNSLVEPAKEVSGVEPEEK